MLSEKEKKARQHKKELNSLRNKMGKNIVWFDSLSLEQKYDLLFLWKKEKHTNKRTKPVKSRSRFSKTGYFVQYPINFKYFVVSKILSRQFRTSILNLRSATIDLILGKK